MTVKIFSSAGDGMKYCAAMMMSLTLTFCFMLVFGHSAPNATIVVLDRAVHFTTSDGGDVQLAAGEYRIEPRGESQLRLTAPGGQPIHIAAAKTFHNETLLAPVAVGVIEEGQDDVLHVVLLLPDGQALDASGSFTGVRSRSVIVSGLTPAQLQMANGQVKASAQQALVPQAGSPSSTVVARVPQLGAAQALAPSAMKTAPSQGPELVSWDYIRMHNPDVIASVIKDVQAGKLDARTLAGLASPATLSTLLKQNYTSVANTVPASPGSTTNRWAEILSPTLNTQLAQSGGVAALKAGPSRLNVQASSFIRTMIPPPDYSPSQLNLGSTYSDHRITGTIRVIAPIDSAVTAYFPNDGKPFRIMKARTLTGRMVSVAYVLPSGQKTQSFVTLYEEATSTMTPPFTLPVQSGQKIEYQVAFEPHMELFGGGNQVGNYSSALQVASDWGWSASVPVMADFRGLAIGVIGTIDDNSPTIIYDGTPCNRLVPVPASMTFINAEQQPRTVSVSMESGGPTLQMQPFTASLAPGERRQVSMPLQVDSCLVFGSVTAGGTIKYAYPGVERRADFSVTMYPSQLHWSHPGDDVGSCHYLWDIFARPNGDTSYYLEFENMSLIASMQLEISFSALGQGLGSVSFQDGPNAAGSIKTQFYTIPWPFVREQYTRLFGAPVEARLNCHTR